MHDEIERLLKAAILAPSGDNLQPWRFRVLAEDTVEFCLDLEVDKSFFNFEQVASIMAVGAAVENVCSLLEENMLSYQFSYDPAREASFLKVGTLRFSLRKLSFEKAIHLKNRCTNRKFYEKAGLDEEFLQKLRARVEGKIEVRVFQGKALENLADLLFWADLIRVERKDLHEFLTHTIRWSEEEITKTRDGMPLSTLEAGRAGELVLRLTRPWPVMKALSKVGLARAMAEHTRKLALSSEGIFAFCAMELNEKSYFEAGCALERIWLELTKRGLAAQPMAAAPLFLLRWQNGRFYDFSLRHQFFMQKIERGFTKFGLKNCLMLLRFGKAPPPRARTPRKDPSCFLI